MLFHSFFPCLCSEEYLTLQVYMHTHVQALNISNLLEVNVAWKTVCVLSDL